MHKWYVYHIAEKAIERHYKQYPTTYHNHMPAMSFELGQVT